MRGDVGCGDGVEGRSEGGGVADGLERGSSYPRPVSMGAGVLSLGGENSWPLQAVGVVCFLGGQPVSEGLGWECALTLCFAFCVRSLSATLGWPGCFAPGHCSRICGRFLASMAAPMFWLLCVARILSAFWQVQCAQAGALRAIVCKGGPALRGCRGLILWLYAGRWSFGLHRCHFVVGPGYMLS